MYLISNINESILADPLKFSTTEELLNEYLQSLEKDVGIYKYIPTIMYLLPYPGWFGLLICIYNSNEKTLWTTPVIILVIYILVVIFMYYTVADLMKLRQVNMLNNIKMSLVYDVIPKISHNYVISNKNNLIQLMNNISISTQEILQAQSQSKLRMLMSYFLLILMVMLIITIIIVVIPLIMLLLAKIIHNSEEKDSIMKATEKSIAISYAIATLSIFGIFITAIVLHVKYLKKLRLPAKIEALITNANIHNDILHHHRLLRQYNRFKSDIKNLIKSYTLVLIQDLKQRLGHVWIIMLLTTIVGICYVLIFAKADAVTKLQKLLGEKLQEGSNLGALRNFILTIIAGVVVIILLLINTIFSDLDSQIQYSKYIEVHTQQLHECLTLLMQMPFIANSSYESAIANTSLLQLQNLTVELGGKIIFDDISLNINPGIYFVVGQSGAGKSSFFDSINSLIIPKSGGIFIDGINSRSLSAEERLEMICYMRQGTLSDNKTLRENIFYRYGVIDETVFREIEPIVRPLTSQKMVVRMGCLLYDIYSREDVKVIIMDEAWAGVETEDIDTVADIMHKHVASPNRVVLMSDHTINTLNKLDVSSIIYLGKKASTGDSSIEITPVRNALQDPKIRPHIPV